jgi:hypothetical protein
MRFYLAPASRPAWSKLFHPFVTKTSSRMISLAIPDANRMPDA